MGVHVAAGASGFKVEACIVCIVATRGVQAARSGTRGSRWKCGREQERTSACVPAWLGDVNRALSRHPELGTGHSWRVVGHTQLTSALACPPCTLHMRGRLRAGLHVFRARTWLRWWRPSLLSRVPVAWSTACGAQPSSRRRAPRPRAGAYFGYGEAGCRVGAAPCFLAANARAHVGSQRSPAANARLAGSRARGQGCSSRLGLPHGAIAHIHPRI